MKTSKKETIKIEALFTMMSEKRYSVEEVSSFLSEVISEASNKKIGCFLNYLEGVYDENEKTSIENVPIVIERKRVFFLLYLSALKNLPIFWARKKISRLISISEVSKAHNCEKILHGIVMKVVRNYSNRELLKNKSLINDYLKVVGKDPQQQQQCSGLHDLLALRRLAMCKLSDLRHDLEFIRRCSKDQDEEVRFLAISLLEKIGGKKVKQAGNEKFDHIAKIRLQLAEILWK